MACQKAGIKQIYRRVCIQKFEIDDMKFGKKIYIYIYASTRLDQNFESKI